MRPATIGLTAGLAAAVGVAAASRGPSLVPWPAGVRRAFPVITGAGAGLAVGLTTAAGAALAQSVTGNGLSNRSGGSGRAWPVRRLLVGGSVAAVAVLGSRITAARLLRRMQEQARGLDPGFADGPTDPLVSGSPDSLVPLLALGREGARFVGSTVCADRIADVTGQPARTSPIRIFVGVDAAPTVPDRVDLAMAELRRTGAFDRGHLLIQAPAGTGYTNATGVDVLELLTGGDCATVAVGYGLLPSFLSLGKVQVAALTQRLLMEAVRKELDAGAGGPRVLLYGESLGAKVQQVAIPQGLRDLDRFGVTSALWVGTPGSAEADAFAERCTGASITVDRPEQVPDPLPRPRPRVWFLAHDGDPVVRFRPELARRRPDWLPTDGSRGRNVPAGMRFLPGITWAQALVDTVFATDVKPGDFRSAGHDYRADLGALVRFAYDLPADDGMAARLETQLRELELARARRIDGG
ncbi:MAG: alpha/beta-hydrolase family protein [Actinomycetales bacterium]